MIESACTTTREVAAQDVPCTQAPRLRTSPSVHPGTTAASRGAGARPQLLRDEARIASVAVETRMNEREEVMCENTACRGMRLFRDAVEQRLHRVGHPICFMLKYYSVM